MKKAMGAGAFVMIILGLFVILIILGAFGKPLLSYTKGLFTKGPLNASNYTQEVLEGVVPGTKVGTVELPIKTLEGDRESIKQQIIAELRACWNIMIRKSAQKEKCQPISFTKETYTKDELVKALEASAGKNAAEALKDNWGDDDSFNRGDKLPPFAYLICADYDVDPVWIPDDEDLFIVNNLNADCE